MDAPPPLAAQAASGGVCDLALTFSRQSDKRRPHEGSVVGGQALTFSHGSSSPRQLQKRQDLPRHKSFSCPGEVSADFSPQKPLAARPLCSWEAGSLSSPLPPSDEVSSTPAAKRQHASRQSVADSMSCPSSLLHTAPPSPPPADRQALGSLTARDRRLLATGGASADTVTAQGVADAAAAASALASAANVSATGVDLFAVAFKVQHDSRLSARQRQVASQRAVAAALEQQQQRFRGRSRKGRLLWAAGRQQLDAATGRKAWKRRAESRLYDAAAVRQSLTALKAARLSGNPQRLAGEIGKALQGHAQAALKEGLYSRTYLGTKDLLEELLSELRLALEDLTLHMQQQPKLRPLLQHAIVSIRRQWKQTALVLSGGAMLGLHHFGLIEALLFNNETQENLLPKVIAGCSAGAAVAAWLCTRTDDELRKELQEDYIHQTFRGLSPNSWIER
ncbi:patatin-like phospholipase domain-containing protein CNBE2340, partial [Cyclospora cayetanensis]|uniref:Patatin-like phospholipase domain-containing protein CNBE2340 n=1 Tax=Cyclospora cayetanensis TaxID=88456 RepID=A0A6P6RXI5_9EIME